MATERVRRASFGASRVEVNGQRYSRHGNAEARDVFRDETSLASRRAQLRWRLGEFLRVSKPREVFKEVYRRRAA
jgi:hypothetical protein